MQRLIDFAPVRAGVSVNCAAHRAGNPRRPFQSCQAEIDRRANERIQRNAGGGADPGTAVPDFDKPDCGRTINDDSSGETVVAEKDIQ